jgi:hypothetical protein
MDVGSRNEAPSPAHPRGEAPNRDIRGWDEPGQDDSGHDGAPRGGGSLWTEEPVARSRLPDPVRSAAVRAVIIVAVTLVQAMIATFCTLAGSWFAFPAVLGAVTGTVVATWGVLDVWVTRQVWNQRHGVVSLPSSTARALRRERRRARRAARAAARARPPRKRLIQA